MAGLIVLGLTVSPGFCQSPTTSPAQGFCLQLSRPPGFSTYRGTRPPHRFGGQVLAAWQKTAKHGPALIYVVGIRRAEVATSADVARSFAAFLSRAGVKCRRSGNFEFGGRPAEKFEMEGKGDGRFIAGLAPGHEGRTTTSMSIIIATNPWSDGKGTDIIQFIMGCNRSDRKDVGEAYRALFHGALLLRKYTPKQGASQAAQAPQAPGPSEDEDYGEDEYGDEAGVIIEGLPAAPGPMILRKGGELVMLDAEGQPLKPAQPEGAPGTAPPDAQTPAEPAADGAPTAEATPAPDAAPTAESVPTAESPPGDGAPAAGTTPGPAGGSATTVELRVGRSQRVVSFVRAAKEGTDTVWPIDINGRADAYVLVWPGRGVLIMSAAEVATRTTKIGNATVLVYSKSLTPFQNAWETVLSLR